MTNQYYFIKPELSSPETKQENIDSWLKTQDKTFYDAQIAKGRDYSFWCKITETAKPNSRTSYTSMANTLNEPSMLDSAGKISFILSEEEVLYIHTLSVVRDGKVIDKLDDINVKVLDYVRDENQASFNGEKEVTVLIQDLHLNDIFIMETSTDCKYKESSIQNDFFRWIYTTPYSYWAYGKYRFELKNETEKNLEANFHYFRDEAGSILEKDKLIIEPNQSYTIEKENYIGADIKELGIYPFIDFVTEQTYPEITKKIGDIYQKIYQVKLIDFATDLVAELDALPSLDHKIKHAIDFVQKEVYYVYNGAEMDVYEPQAAEVTYKTKQGDCKAKTVLLKIILNHLGLDSELILVNYGNDIFLSMYTPSPFNFNHAILKVTQNQHVYFIDATMSNDHGFLANRQKNSFMYYLEVKAGSELQKQEPFQDEIPAIEEKFYCDVKGNVAEVVLERTLRGEMANQLRELFKNDSNSEIIDQYNYATYDNMYLYKNYEDDEIDNYFSKTSIEIVKDNKELNEISLIYKATISKPYIIKSKKQVLHFWGWDYFVDEEARNYVHKDFPYRVERNYIKAEFHLMTDRSIDQTDSYTRQECDIKSKYVKHRVTKKISKHGASCYIDYQPYHNLTLSGKELNDYVKVNKEILDNNWGISIDILE
ncbi:transglutaminase family protein [Listeria welshimeri]|nr:transglutaminase family protein [Listeria welshimeri]MBC1346893.1 transglutaminase family protein [Listeria welshimeri]